MSDTVLNVVQWRNLVICAACRLLPECATSSDFDCEEWLRKRLGLYRIEPVFYPWLVAELLNVLRERSEWWTVSQLRDIAQIQMIVNQYVRTYDEDAAFMELMSDVHASVSGCEYDQKRMVHHQYVLLDDWLYGHQIPVVYTIRDQ